MRFGRLCLVPARPPGGSSAWRAGLTGSPSARGRSAHVSRRAASRPTRARRRGVACLFRRLTLEPARWVPRIAAASACHRILILSRAPRAARPYPVPGKAGRLALEVVRPEVAGIDVHKKVISVAIGLPGEQPGQRALTVRRFKTFWRALQKMAAWLCGLGVTDAAMESTGVYWWPVYHALAQAGIEVCVCNAAHMRNVPGRKRDIADCQWIAELHEYGLLRPSFIPADEVAGLRQRTRYRKKLIQQRSSEGQRLSKVLADAGIKIDSVAGKLLIKSGRKMIAALIAGERNPGRLADLAEGVLRRKTDELQMACDGRFTDSH